MDANLQKLKRKLTKEKNHEQEIIENKLDLDYLTPDLSLLQLS